MSDRDLLGTLKIDDRDRDDHGRRARWVPWLAAGVATVVLVALAAGWFVLHGGRAVAVQTVTASRPAQAGSAEAVLQATGYVTARRQATVSAQIIGTLTEVTIEEGDFVERDQVLARLDDSAQKVALDVARTGVGQAQAQLEQLRVQSRQAQRELKRQEELRERQLTSGQALEMARTEVESLMAQIAAAEAGLKAAQAQVAVAEVNYDYTVVRAPFSGVITQKAAQVGEIIAPSAAGGGFTRTGVGTVVDMDSLEVEVDVNEAYIGRVSAGMPAEAVLDAYPDWRIPARVIAIVPAADRGKATVKVRVALDEKDERIVPDMGVRVSFMESRPKSDEAPPEGVLVPASAVVTRDGAAVVFVVRDDAAKAVQVSPASGSHGSFRLIPAGISPGEKVIDKPASELADGARVRTAR
ncbi:MAG TPA: efflux RND transporter periplasmic adaptor subunit [Wenzhouxiangella sp.]|nr:efflux RND transporter periplasmic adaptor subunit [Wenzhouxiangella sp.]